VAVYMCYKSVLLPRGSYMLHQVAPALRAAAPLLALASAGLLQEKLRDTDAARARVQLRKLVRSAGCVVGERYGLWDRETSPDITDKEAMRSWIGAAKFAFELLGSDHTFNSSSDEVVIEAKKLVEQIYLVGSGGPTRNQYPFAILLRRLMEQELQPMLKQELLPLLEQEEEAPEKAAVDGKKPPRLFAGGGRTKPAAEMLGDILDYAFERAAVQRDLRIKGRRRKKGAELPANAEDEDRWFANCVWGYVKERRPLPGSSDGAGALLLDKIRTVLLGAQGSIYDEVLDTKTRRVLELFIGRLSGRQGICGPCLVIAKDGRLLRDEYYAADLKQLVALTWWQTELTLRDSGQPPLFEHIVRCDYDICTTFVFREHGHQKRCCTHCTKAANRRNERASKTRRVVARVCSHCW
jgi:hypothetical protein